MVFGHKPFCPKTAYCEPFWLKNAYFSNHQFKCEWIIYDSKEEIEMKISICKNCGVQVADIENAIWVEWRDDDDCGCESDEE